MRTFVWLGMYCKMILSFSVFDRIKPCGAVLRNAWISSLYLSTLYSLSSLTRYGHTSNHHFSPMVDNCLYSKCLASSHHDTTSSAFSSILESRL